MTETPEGTINVPVMLSFEPTTDGGKTIEIIVEPKPNAENPRIVVDKVEGCVKIGMLLQCRYVFLFTNQKKIKRKKS